MSIEAIDTDGVHAVAVAFAGGWWTVRVRGVTGMLRVRRLDQAESAARELVAESLGVPPQSIRVRIIPDDDRLAEVRRRRSWCRRG